MLVVNKMVWGQDNFGVLVVNKMVWEQDNFGVLVVDNFGVLVVDKMVWEQDNFEVLVVNRLVLEQDNFGVRLCRCVLQDVCLETPRYFLGLLTCEFLFPIDRTRAIARLLSLRSAAIIFSAQSGIPLSSIQTSFADETKWWMRVEMPYNSFHWTSITIKTPFVFSPVLVAELIMQNLFRFVLLGGLPEIETFVLESQTTITTMGSNLQTILGMPEVNARRTISNDCAEMGNVFGVYAARKSLEHELMLVMSATNDVRHIQLIARKMASNLTLKGMQIDQTGQSIPPLMRASYEKASMQMTEYCAAAEKDRGETICAAALGNILLRVGTGYQFQLGGGIGEQFRPSVTTPAPVIIPRIREYVWSFKLDGTRFLLVLMRLHGRQVFVFISRKNEMSWIGGPEKPYSLFDGSVLDGEMCGSGNVFCIFDCLMVCGNRCSSARYDLRMEVAYECIKRLRPWSTQVQAVNFYASHSIGTNKSQAIQIFGFFICVKPIFSLSVLRDLRTSDGSKLSFPSDGLIFTSLKGVTPFRVSRESIFKWKVDHTIDCVVQLYNDGCPNLTGKYHVPCGRYSLWSREGTCVARANEATEWIRDNEVYECRWSTSEWIITRWRDKQANNMETILATIQNLEEQISLQELFFHFFSPGTTTKK